LSPHEECNFFDAFDAAIAGDATLLSRWLTRSSQGIEVYRNTIASGAIDALAATFATVQQMVGEEWFRAAAREVVRSHPPGDPALINYGSNFPLWLADFPPAADTPYLAGVARLDWLWWQSWSAADASLLDAASLSELSPEILSSTGLGLHPTLRLAEFDTGIPSLWLAHQSPLRGEAHQLDIVPERILFIRTGAHVQSHLVDPATFAFLQALQRHDSIVAAAEQAFAADPACSLPHILTGGIALGLFSTINPIPDAPA
jgi:hypothetical protein